MVTGYPVQQVWVIDGMGGFPSELVPSPPELRWQNSATINTTGNNILLRDQLAQGNLATMCEGSVKNGLGTAAWIITSENLHRQHLITGFARSPVKVANMTSHRAACTGIMGGVFILHNLLLEWGTGTGTVTFRCDNISAIRHSLDTASVPNISGLPDFDIIQSIRNCMSTSVIMDGNI
jgi:hypothetical protein